MPWSLVLLLGGGFALAKASTVSGLSAMMGRQLEALGDLPQWVIGRSFETFKCNQVPLPHTESKDHTASVPLLTKMTFFCVFSVKEIEI